MIYVIHAIMCILTDGNQIQIGFGLLKVNVFSHDWYHLTFIFQVPYKKLMRKILHIYIYTCYDIFVAGGEHQCFYICYNPFSAGEENITYFLQGEYSCTQSVIIKKRENVGTCFDEDFCEAFHLEL